MNCELTGVALRKESVDRNGNLLRQIGAVPVALRKESVDRNAQVSPTPGHGVVALRKESVDRNALTLTYEDTWLRRSPQGERG